MSLTRIQEAILGKDILPGSVDETIDLTYGGQFGFSPRLGIIGEDGQNASEWISNQPYVKNNVIPVLLQAPLMFDIMDNTGKLVSILKSLIELRSKTIDGLTRTMTVEVNETPLGGGGQQQQDATNVTIANGNVTHTYSEVQGMAVNRFFTMMIEYGLMDPYTKHSKIGNVFESKNVLWTPDFYTFTTLYIVPNITADRVVDAYLRTNMFPLSAGDVTDKRDLNSSKEVPEYSIEFTGFNMMNANVIKLAQSILDKMSLHKFDSDRSPLFVSTNADKAVQPNLKSDITPVGISDLDEE